MKSVLASTMLVALALAGCAGAPASESEGIELEITESGEWSTDGGRADDMSSVAETIFGFVDTFDYQLGGAYDLDDDIDLVARDRTDEPAPGTPNICYINGFQSQPGEAEFWLEEHPTLVLRDNAGKPVIDENWPDEFLFDTSTAENRTLLGGIIGEWIDGCSDAGFAAVEFDNLDSYTRSGGALDAEDNLALAALLVSHASEAGLPSGQKNAAELANRAHAEAGFHFAITEECHRWNECSSYAETYGELVFNIEYTDDLRGTVDTVCGDSSIPARTIIRDRNLTTPDDPDYFYRACS